MSYFYNFKTSVLSIVCDVIGDVIIDNIVDSIKTNICELFIKKYMV